MTFKPTAEFQETEASDAPSVRFRGNAGFLSGETQGLASEVRPLSGKESLRRANQPRVIRRLDGVLIQVEGQTAHVKLIDKGLEVDYSLPASALHKAGIRHHNQPFEMDEVEHKNPDGSYLIGYVYRALANQEDAFADTVDLDAARVAKRTLILEKFKNATP